MSGFIPYRRLGQTPTAVSPRAYEKANGSGSAMFKGDPVKVVGGYVTAAAAGDSVIGAIAGFAYISDTTKLPVFSDQIPASCSSNGIIEGYSNVVVYVLDDPYQTFKIKTRVSLAVSATNIGSYFSISAGTGNTLTGQSGVVLQDVVTSLDKSMVKLVGITRAPDNLYDVSGNYAEVLFTNHLWK